MLSEELTTYVRARYTLVYLLTPEEQRVLADLEQLAAAEKRPLAVWSHARGLRGQGIERGSAVDPLSALEAIARLPDKALVVLLDFHPFLRDAGVVRALKEVGQELETTCKTVLLVSPVLALPVELEKDVVVVDVPLPDRALLRENFREVASSLGGAQVVLTEPEVELLVRSGQGLTLKEFTNVLAKTLVTRGRIDREAIDVVNAEKRQAIRKSGILEFYPVSESFESIGGLAHLKDWLTSRGRAFGDAARKFGLPLPKGALIVGVQGCGKSLTAKAVADAWRLPLVKLDVGRLFGGLVGASEENVRRAIQLAEAVAPCVLWIDEIEKGLSGLGSSGTSDGGTTARVIGTFLTWMQEKTKPVFVVATSNDLGALPPELMRKGRFDEIFFVDLPGQDERAAIFAIHLEKRLREPSRFDLEALSTQAKGFSGAEIEEAVVAGLFRAFERGTDLETADVLEAMRETVPLSVVMEEKITRLREWARLRTRPASSSAGLSESVRATIAERLRRIVGDGPLHG